MVVAVAVMVDGWIFFYMVDGLPIFISLSFSFFSSVSIIHCATISVVRVVMDIFINQGASKFFY